MMLAFQNETMEGISRRVGVSFIACGGLLAVIIIYVRNIILANSLPTTSSHPLPPPLGAPLRSSYSLPWHKTHFHPCSCFILLIYISQSHSLHRICQY